MLEGSRKRRRRSRRANRARAQVWSQGFVAEAIDQLLPHPGDHGCQRRAAPRRTDRGATWRTGRRTSRPPLTCDYGRYTVLQGRRLEPGAGPAPAAGAAERHAASTAFDPTERGIHPPAGRGAPSSPLPIARNSTAIRTSPRCRSKRLLSDTYNADAPQAHHRQGLARAAARHRFARIRGRLSSCAAKAARASPSAALGRRRDRPSAGMGEVRGDTVHFDIIDRAGNMISATPSGGWLQSSPVIPELGF